ncbi:hypothetical protein CTZ27_21585 [Streptomyces griseocarneus]|nr:hypothetical protein CTZ27_21585 [Streptomyces griseocarneus]
MNDPVNRQIIRLRLRYLAAWRLGETHRAMELYEELRTLQREREASADGAAPPDVSAGKGPSAAR